MNSIKKTHAVVRVSADPPRDGGSRRPFGRTFPRSGSPDIEDADFEIIDDRTRWTRFKAWCSRKWTAFTTWLGRMWAMFWSWLTKKMKTPKGVLTIIGIVLFFIVWYFNKQGVSKVASFSLWKVGIFLAVAALAWLLFWKISRDGVGSLSWPRWLTLQPVIVVIAIALGIIFVTKQGMNIMAIDANAAMRADSAARVHAAMCLKNEWMESWNGKDCDVPARMDSVYVQPGVPLVVTVRPGYRIDSWFDCEKIEKTVDKNNVLMPTTYTVRDGVEDSVRVTYIRHRPRDRFAPDHNTCSVDEDEESQ